MTEWGEFAEQVRSWRRVRSEDAEHASFLAEAYHGGQTAYQAAVGWALVRRNAALAHRPRKDRKPPPRLRRRGRVTVALRRPDLSGVPGSPTRTSKRHAAVTRQLRSQRIAVTHAEVRRARQTKRKVAA